MPTTFKKFTYALKQLTAVGVLVCVLFGITPVIALQQLSGMSPVSEQEYSQRLGAKPYDSAKTYELNELIIEAVSGNIYRNITPITTPETFNVAKWQLVVPNIATQAEAEAGTSNERVMTPLRSLEALLKNRETNLFSLFDNTDTTKRLQFDLSGLTSGQTRVIFMPDKNVDLGKIGIQAYDATKTYDIGDLTHESGINYRCTTAVTAPEAFDPAKWTALSYDLLDEDDFNSDSDTQGATQQSIAAYISSQGFTDTSQVNTAVTAGINNLINGAPAAGDTLNELYTAIQAITGGLQLQPTNPDLSGGAFPSGALQGYFYIVGVGGTVDGIDFSAGDSIIALVDAASTTTYLNNWYHIPKVDTVLNTTTAYYQTTTTGQTDANSLTPVALQWNTTPLHNSNTSIFAPVATGVQVLEDGDYKVTANVYQTTNSNRTNVGIQVTLNGTAQGIVGANSYIRNNSGHNESSSIVVHTITASAGDIIGVQGERLAGGGTVTIPAGSSNLIVEAALTSFGGGGGGTANLLDEDDFTSDSDTEGATQQSIKAYVDTRAIDAPYTTRTSPLGFMPNTQKTVAIPGVNFTPNTTISIPGFDGTIDTVNTLSPTELEITITPGTTETTYDLIISNGDVNNTVWTGNGVGLIEVATNTWNDLRSSGVTFTHGNGAGNDIRYLSGMNMVQDANGMYFTGANPWSSWVKFEVYGWTRGSNKTIEWILTSPDAAMMVGIGSDQTNETSTAQFLQGEVLAYFNSATNLSALYGNNGTPGSTGNMTIGTALSAGITMKIKIESDGDVGDTFTLYQLPSADPSDWEDESTVVVTTTIGGTLNPGQTNLMPMIIPRSGGSQRFLAVRVE